tara:strand:+ start:17173 stop:17499 length:327 start_codon:yes stop_codon:yes gene_type:complete
MSQISDLYKKVKELQDQIDEIKTQNKKFQDIIDASGGTLSKKKTGDTPPSSSAGCGVKLNYKEQVILKSITTQLRTKRIMTIKLLNYIDRILKSDPHFVHQVNKEKTS